MMALLRLLSLSNWLLFGGAALVGAGGAFASGYALRARQDRSATLDATIKTLRKDIADRDAIASAAARRLAAAEQERDQNRDKVQALDADLAIAKNDCVPTDNQRRELLGIDAGAAKGRSAAGSGPLRRARPAAAAVKPGAIASLGRYRAALGVCNRRLADDFDFYADVRRRNGADSPP